MAEGLKINITADVAQATQGLSAVEIRATQLQVNIEKLQNVIANTTSQKKLTSALDALNQQQKALNQTLSASATKLGGIAPNANQAGTAVGNLSRIVQDAPFGFIAISNNLQPLFDDFTRLKGQTGSVGGALKALTGAITGPAGIGLAFAAATSLITLFSKEIFSSGEAAKKTKTDADNLKDSIKGIYGETAKEASAVNGFVAILNSETETRQRKLSAIKELQAIQPDIFNGLKLEGEAVVGLDSAYQNYIQNLKTVLAVKIKQAQQEQLIEKLLKAEGVTLTANEKLLSDGTKKLQQSIANDPRLGPEGGRVTQYYKDQEAASKKATDKLRKDIENLQADITTLSAGIKTSPIALKEEKVKFDFTPIVGFRKLTIEEGELAKQFEIGIITKAYEKKIKEGFKDLKPIKIPLRIAPELVAIQEAFEKQKDEFTKLVGGLVNGINQEVGAALGGLFEGIGEALGGENISQKITSIFSSLLSVVGKALIQYGIVKEGLDKILGPAGFAIPGATAIGLGIAAIAASTLLKNFGGARADGGPVSGNTPYLVGERGPELFVPATSGKIVPNNEVSSFGGGLAAMLGGSGRGGTTLRGQDIILAYARAQRSQIRVNG